MSRFGELVFHDVPVELIDEIKALVNDRIKKYREEVSKINNDEFPESLNYNNDIFKQHMPKNQSKPYYMSNENKRFYASPSGSVISYTLKDGDAKIKPVKMTLTPFGYYSVPGINYPLHRLVFESFVSRVEDKHQIDHIDNNTNNNAISNLRDVPADVNMSNRRKWAAKMLNKVPDGAKEIMSLTVRNNVYYIGDGDYKYYYLDDEVYEVHNIEYVKYEWNYDIAKLVSNNEVKQTIYKLTPSGSGNAYRIHTNKELHLFAANTIKKQME